MSRDPDEPNPIDDARQQQLLAARARELAKPILDEERGETLELVEFTLGNERYAIELQHVLEIVRLIRFTPVPAAPDFIFGVTSLRGEIIAVVDARRIFGVHVAGISDMARLLVIGDRRVEFGLLVDQVTTVNRIAVTQLMPAAATISGERRPFVRALGPDALVVIDGAALRADARLTAAITE